jgi:hypothetical protein
LLEAQCDKKGFDLLVDLGFMTFMIAGYRRRPSKSGELWKGNF